MKKTLKIISIVIALLFLVFLVFLSLGGFLAKRQREKADVLYAKMVETGNFSFCQKTKGGGMGSSTTFKDICIDGYLYQFAKSLDVCEYKDIKDVWYRRDKCYQKVAENTGDVAICKKFGEIVTYSYPVVDSCIAGIARQRQDISFCNEISTEYIRAGCFLSFASNKKDIEVCKVDKSEATRKQCEEEFNQFYSESR